MKLVIAIVQEHGKQKLCDALVREGIPYTKLESWGGFLQARNFTFMIGVDEAEVPHVLNVIKGACRVAERFVNVSEAATPHIPLMSPNPIKVETGGAVAFVVDVDSFHRF
jgi:uncharacterized protein YaaQ